MRKTSVVLHHSLTKDSGTVSWGAIRRYHTTPKPQGMGMLAIGYQYGIDLVGDAYETMVGRMEEETAAAAPGANQNGIHICLVGNFDVEPVPAAQMKSAVTLAASICRRWQIQPSQIFGHRDFNAAKSCPGNLVDLKQFRADVAALLALVP